jgi:hypothetical protein
MDTNAIREVVTKEGTDLPEVRRWTITRLCDPRLCCGVSLCLTEISWSAWLFGRCLVGA